MASYIKSGLTERAALAQFFTETPLNRNDRWYELESIAEVLEQSLYELRAFNGSHWCNKKDCTLCANQAKRLEAIRELRKQLSAIGIEQREITYSLNPKYVSYWGLDQYLY